MATVVLSLVPEDGGGSGDLRAMLADFESRLSRHQAIEVMNVASDGSSVSRRYTKGSTEAIGEIAAVSIALYTALKDEDVRAIARHLVDALRPRRDGQLSIIVKKNEDGKSEIRLNATGSEETLIAALEEVLRRENDDGDD